MLTVPLKFLGRSEVDAPAQHKQSDICSRNYDLILHIHRNGENESFMWSVHRHFNHFEIPLGMEIA